MTFQCTSASGISCDLLRLTNAKADTVMPMTSEFHSNLDTTDLPINEMTFMEM